MARTQKTQDHIDRARAQWARQLPDLDTGPMEVLGRIYRLSRLVTPSIEATFASFNLDRGEFDVVATLLRSGPPHRLTPTELYRSLMIASGSLTHRLGRLEKAGLIKRVPSDNDGRSLAVQLTDEGARRAEAAFRQDMANEAEAIAGFDPDKKAQLAGLLRELNLAVEAHLSGKTTGEPTQD
ncbi:MarR family winged helix-turn-helix transcriptional regulator [Neorhizobium galegae]|uniref:MarR family winged helix-turn-helix transcriptional regulator n=1 Tax=Neorhizobium galegae TaxID=399 RepID=UPI0006223F67|nr:MarR family transcriptional regulator [Neorhizobium galegae]CDZ30311.1 Transcriptional regulator PecS [Neorhizobium galegae bv. officinalis]KAA9386343.1 MarR family transcriptional regulator [Neorhizobium galegae]KAB1112801.1 MarR family transcriptional regulator [Neorhizobium galegae]MCM2500750.1 MarR family transcriptional regulator [Neorhizobium galegae]MCQ1770709.1 MarR family transcriptional regulator [Neorhizobium galegae]